MKIWVAPYTLTARRSLSGRAKAQARRGSLLRIEKDNCFGYADLHPWPELGDLDLNQQLEALKTGKTTALTKRSLELAELDCLARANERSAFYGLVVPTSHFLVTEIESLTSTDLQAAWRSGFRVVKIKLGRDLKRELFHLLELERDLAPFRLRFDFNATQDSGGSLAFFESLPSSLRLSIEFIEDPTEWNPEKWRDLQEASGLPLALDLALSAAAKNFEGGDHNHLQLRGSESAQWLVLKPAIQNPQEIFTVAENNGLRICVTSYLDHPVGQVGAALEAARLVALTPGSGRVGVCGLLSHFAYEENEFSEDLRTNGPRLVVPDEHGIGFTDLLEQQDWKPLK